MNSSTLQWQEYEVCTEIQPSILSAHMVLIGGNFRCFAVMFKCIPELRLT